MRSSLFRRVSRVAAMLLLVWTAVDLAFAGLCALDREQADLGLPSMAVARADEATASGPAHVDDCFCCSRCVSLTVPAPVHVANEVKPFRPVATASRLLGFPPRLNHPPQGPSVLA
jgi:hypothetical protein